MPFAGAELLKGLKEEFDRSGEDSCGDLDVLQWRKEDVFLWAVLEVSLLMAAMTKHA